MSLEKNKKHKSVQNEPRMKRRKREPPVEQQTNEWDDVREKTFRIWIRQLIALSFLYMKATSWSRVNSFFITIVSLVCSAYTIPGYGCGLVSGSVCVTLQWSGIALGLLSAITSGITFVYSPDLKVMQYEATQKWLLRIARLINLELQKPMNRREPAIQFAQTIVDQYDHATENIRLPWYINGERQLANISLLQHYGILQRESSSESKSSKSKSSESKSSESESESESDSSTEVTDDSRINSQKHRIKKPFATVCVLEDVVEKAVTLPVIELNADDRAVMESISRELERLGSSEIDLELGKLSEKPK